MMGVAVDPSFTSNRRIYTCFLSNAGGSPDVRVVRWRMNDAVTALTDRADIVTGIPVSSGRHSGCRTALRSRRPALDRHRRRRDAHRARRARRRWAARCSASNTSGQGVPGNAPAPFDPRIYTYGHRNVQGIAFSPGGKAYSIEHGTGRDDEVNRLFAGAQLRLGPAAAVGAVVLRRVPADDRQDAAPERPAGGVVVRRPRPSRHRAATSSADRAWKGWDRSLAMAVLKGQQLRVLRLDTTGTPSTPSGCASPTGAGSGSR